MEKETNKIKNSVYVGMSIFNVLKDCSIKINEQILSLEDKKYLSLYLGLINVHSKESFNLDMNIYIDLYKKYFIDIIDNINFNSLDDYIEFLLNNDIVKQINKNRNKENISNKQLVKK